MAPLKKVLVVDDEPEIVWVILAMLEDEGVSVIGAHRGDEALEIARRERPDLVITDIMMPGLDGRELCRRLQADPALRGIPVVLMSAVYRLEFRNCDSAAFLAKPFGIAELIALVHRLLPPTT
jgi:CheY-like chemotaxis protein